MMTDLAATIATARANLRTIWNAHESMFAINLDYGPGAWKADGMPVHRDPPAEGSILRWQGRNPSTTALSAAYDASVTKLADALVPASEITGIDDGVAQGSVLPHNQSHISLAQAQSIARLVNYTLITTAALVEEANAELVFEVKPDDDRWIREVCDQVLAALLCLPDDLVTDPPAGVRRAKPSHKRCANCKRWIPWGVNRCGKCQEFIAGALSKDADHKHDVPAQLRCAVCGRVVQDRGSRCWACRKRRERKAS